MGKDIRWQQRFSNYNKALAQLEKAVKLSKKRALSDLVKANTDKFLDHVFDIQDELYEGKRGCVRYIARQREEFSLEVSEWHYVRNGLIEEIVAYYHIGEIREERKLSAQ